MATSEKENNSDNGVEAFQKAQADVVTLKPSSHDLLLLYGLFQQATNGDNNTPAPSKTNSLYYFYQKWKSWEGRKGLTAADAQKLYIEHVEGLKKARLTKSKL